MQIDLKTINERYKVPLSGLIHVGANTGQELQGYIDAGLAEIMFFEPIKSVYQQLEAHVDAFQNKAKIKTFNYALGATAGSQEIYLSNHNFASSSLLQPETGKKLGRNLKFDGKETINVKRMDELLPRDHPYNSLLLDVQGFELEVLKGAGDLLPHFDFIICEINRVLTYKGSANVADIDDYLEKAGYLRMETYWMGRNWGDGLYMKKKFVTAEMQPLEVDNKRKRGLIKRLIYPLIGRH